MRLGLATFLMLAVALFGVRARAQEGGLSKPEPKYDDTFSGSIIELSTSKITVSRSILGKPAEKRVFLIKSDTRIEGKLRVRVKVTIGFIASDEGEVARLIVVRQKPPEKK